MPGSRREPPRRSMHSGRSSRAAPRCGSAASTVVRSPNWAVPRRETPKPVHEFVRSYVLGPTKAAVENGSQLLVNRLACAKDSRAHGTYRAIHGLRDVFVAQSFQLAKHDRGPQVLRQILDGAVHRVANLIGEQQAFGSLGLGQPGMPSVLFRLLKVEIVIHRPAFRGNQGVLRGIDCDSIQPRIERAIAAKRLQRTERFDESLLSDVFC